MAMKEYGSGPSPVPGPSREPQWTTGQGIGFLVALPGCLLALVGLIGLMVTDGSPGNYIFGSGFARGAIGAIPGTIVFNKCSRPAVRPAAARERPSSAMSRSLEADSKVAETTESAERRRNARDAVVLDAALQLSRAIHTRRLQTGAQTIPRNSAKQYLSAGVIDRATRLGITFPASAAVNRAIGVGWLKTEGSGADEVLSCTSDRLPTMSDIREDEPVSDGEDPGEPEAD